MNGTNLSRGGHTSAVRDTRLGPMWIPPGVPPCAKFPDEFSDIEPKRGRKAKGDPELAHIAAMKEICRTQCKFTEDCLKSALLEEGGRTSQYRHGIRGATTPQERETLARYARKRTA